MNSEETQKQIDALIPILRESVSVESLPYNRPLSGVIGNVPKFYSNGESEPGSPYHEAIAQDEARAARARAMYNEGPEPTWYDPDGKPMPTEVGVKTVHDDFVEQVEQSIRKGFFNCFG